MNAIIDEETKRARALLGPDRVRFPLQETQPLMTPDSIGALAGIGFTAKDPEVHLSVYIYPTWHQDPKTAEKLKEHIPSAGARTLHGINGRLFYFGYTHVDGPNGNIAKYRLSELVSALAGDE